MDSVAPLRDSDAATRAMETAPLVNTNTRLSGYRLALARLATMALAVLTLAVFLFLLPAYLTFLHTVYVGPACPVGQLPPQTAQALRAVGCPSMPSLLLLWFSRSSRC